MNERTRSGIITIALSLAMSSVLPFMVLITGASLWYLIPAVVLSVALTFAYWFQPR